MVGDDKLRGNVFCDSEVHIFVRTTEHTQNKRGMFAVENQIKCWSLTI